MAREKQIIEYVPNFNGGRNKDVIKQITDEVERVKGVKLLDVDPGGAANHATVTFIGEPSVVVETAFRCVKRTVQLIDMRQHHGVHPRMGATDVCPLIPVAGITLEECTALARKLAERIANELQAPCYCYEAAVKTPERKNLAICRKGKYEELPQRMSEAAEAPDYGAREWDEQLARTGCTAVGARGFLIATNFNLNTTSTRRANAIAFDVRERGRLMREGGSSVGKPMKDEKGEIIIQPGMLKATKAIGWFIDEYGIAQVSMNIANINITPFHTVFDEVCRCAQNRGIHVTGTEMVGLIPKRTLLEAGTYFLKKQQRPTGIPEEDTIKIAIMSMGLDDLKPFNPREKVTEYLLEDADKTPKLIDLTVKRFANETSRGSPAPGGGTISAYMGALGAALGTTIADLSNHKAGWDARWEGFSNWAEKGQAIQAELMILVDEGTEAFNRIMSAFGLPKGTDEEKAARFTAIREATPFATEVPLRTMKASYKVFELCRTMAEEGNPNSVSDAGVGVLVARAAVLGAGLNVKINASGLKGKEKAEHLVAEANKLIAQANEAEAEIMKIVEAKL